LVDLMRKGGKSPTRPTQSMLVGFDGGESRQQLGRVMSQ
jgi:hypothetical protein